MKILWFVNTPCSNSTKGGKKIITGSWIDTLRDALKVKEGIELHICCPTNTPTDDFECDSVMFHPLYRHQFSNKLQVLLYRVRMYYGFYETSNLKPYLDIVERVKPDLIHFHGSECDYGQIQEYIDIPSVLSIQGVINTIYEKYFCGVPLGVINRYESWRAKFVFESGKATDRNYRHYSAVEKKTLSLTENVIGRTDWDRRVMRVLAPKAHYYIGGEILRRQFYHNVWDKKAFGRPFTIVSTITNGIYKGMEVVLRTSQHLKELGFDFRWKIIGQQENTTNNSLISKWLRLGFKDCNIEFLGRRGADEMVGIMCDADIYCQVSHIENSPNSLCEAMMLGMPVIASYAGGTISVLGSGDNSIMVQDGDSYALAGAIIELASDYGHAVVMGRNARKTAIDNHDPEKIAEGYVNIYKDVLNNAGVK